MSKDSEEKFDKMLYRALKRHSEPVPADFTDRMLRQIREAENSRILARVVMEERLTLVGCIALGIMTIVAVVVFPSIAISFKEWFGRLTILSGVEGLVVTSMDKVAQTIGAVRYEWGSPLVRLGTPYGGGSQWQLYMVFAGVFGFAVCSLVDLLWR